MKKKEKEWMHAQQERMKRVKTKYWDPAYTRVRTGFDDLPVLNREETAFVLRTLKYHLEERVGWTMSDEYFVTVIKTIPRLHAASPAFGGLNDLAFIQPINRLDKDFGVPDCLPRWGGFLGYFRVFDFKDDCDDRHYEDLLLHIPHSSTVIPKEGKSLFGHPESFDEEEKKLIDWYTDELFANDDDDERIEKVVFPYCRLFCDVERLPDDPLEKKGLGIYKTNFPLFEPGPIRQWADKKYSYREYLKYHEEVIMKLVEKGYRTLLLDCHSFSALPNLLNPNPPQDIDICIGYNEDNSKPRDVVIGNIHNFFLSRGYRVGINTPFSNSKTFDVPGGSRYHSVMIEVNKSLYMDEKTLAKTDGFDRLHHDLQDLYASLLYMRREQKIVWRCPHHDPKEWFSEEELEDVIIGDPKPETPPTETEPETPPAESEPQPETPTAPRPKTREQELEEKREAWIKRAAEELKSQGVSEEEIRRRLAEPY